MYAGYFKKDAITQASSGALYELGHGTTTHAYNNGNNTYAYIRIGFNARNSNSIYVNNGEVRPTNYTIKVWLRTA